MWSRRNRRMRKPISLFFCLMACLIWAGCSSTKSLKPGQYLYTGADVKINPDSSGKIANEKNIKADLIAKSRPKPNASLLGIKYKLAIYNLAGTPKKPKGFKNWLRKKGEAPVLLNTVNIRYNTDVLTSYLISLGYLQANIKGDTLISGKKGKVIYTVNTGRRYKINQVTFPPDSGILTKIINQNKTKSLIRPGDFYDLERFKNERVRIDNDLKENGYFYFNPDYILLQVDSTIGKNLVNVNLKLKDIAPDAALKPYTINQVNIYPTYALRKDSILRKIRPLIYNGYKIYDTVNTYKPKLFDRLVFFHRDERYNRKDHNQTLNRLVNIGSFQDVRAEFIPVDTGKNSQLNLNLYLTPLKKNSLSFSVLGTSKSNNFVGSEVKVTQTTRNLFRGAEQLDVSLSGGFETQVKGTAQGKNSYSFTAETKLTIPRLVIPFYHPNTTNAFIPRTITSLSYQRINRGSEYSLNSAKIEYGYNFKENAHKEHNLNPISVNYVSTSFPTDSIRDSLFRRNPLLRSTLEKQFIIGSNYNFTFTNQMEENRRNTSYFYGSIETGGNVWGLFTPKNSVGERTLFGTPLTQFIRLEADGRDYYKISKNLTWANRLNIGYGYAYGNSSSLPFVRQFFAGGSNDIRAFPARTLGPGTYKVPASATFADQGGDIKLMLNSELRFKIFSVLFGALFVDAGNIWLRKEDQGDPNVPGSGRPGSGFKFNNALNELAVGTGAGLRVDASIFVIRLDVAFPLRKPYLPDGQRWVFNSINFGSPDWRKQNLIFNIGIGYPF